MKANFNEKIKILFNLKNKLFQFNLFLIFLSILSIGQISNYQTNKFLEYLFLFIILQLIGLSFFLIKKVFMNDKLINLHNVCISISIIFLIIHPTNLYNKINIVSILSIVCILLFFKVFNIRYKGFPIFNPAPFAIFIYFSFFEMLSLFNINIENTFISWWGANLLKSITTIDFLNYIFAFILSSISIYYSYSFKKFKYGGSFFLTYFVLNLILSFMYNQNNFLNIFFLNTLNLLIFFVFVMLTEPKTTPTKNYEQIIYGILSACLYTLLNQSIVNQPNLPYIIQSTEIITILTINLIYFIHKYTHNIKNK